MSTIKNFNVKNIKKIRMDGDPCYNLINELIENLAEIYDIDNLTVKWGSGSGCYHSVENFDVEILNLENGLTKKRAVNPKSHVLYFGERDILSLYSNGYREYSTVKKELSEYNFKKFGSDALILIACHEFSHVLQSIDGIDYNKKTGRRIIHGSQFIRIYKEILDLIKLPLDKKLLGD